MIEADNRNNTKGYIFVVSVWHGQNGTFGKYPYYLCVLRETVRN